MYEEWLRTQLANCYAELDRQRKENEKLQRELKRYKANEKLFGWDKEETYYERYHGLLSIIEQVKELVNDA